MLKFKNCNSHRIPYCTSMNKDFSFFLSFFSSRSYHCCRRLTFEKVMKVLRENNPQPQRRSSDLPANLPAIPVLLLGAFNCKSQRLWFLNYFSLRFFVVKILQEYPQDLRVRIKIFLSFLLSLR